MPYARVSLARASRPAQKDTPCPNPLAQHQPDARGAHPDHPLCSTAARAVPGCSSQGARVQATTSRDRRMRICPAPCPPHPQKPMQALLAGWRMARAGRLVSLVAGRAGAPVTPPLCDEKHSIWTRCVQPRRRMLRCTHMGSCESVVGAIAEPETAA